MEENSLFSVRAKAQWGMGYDISEPKQGKEASLWRKGPAQILERVKEGIYVEQGVETDEKLALYRGIDQKLNILKIKSQDSPF